MLTFWDIQQGHSKVWKQEGSLNEVLKVGAFTIDVIFANF